MTYDEFKRVAESVTSDTTLSGYVIENVTERDVRPVPGVNMSEVVTGRDTTFIDQFVAKRLNQLPERRPAPNPPASPTSTTTTATSL
jgi:hypothetical protein